MVPSEAINLRSYVTGWHIQLAILAVEDLTLRSGPNDLVPSAFVMAEVVHVEPDSTQLFELRVICSHEDM